MSVSNKRHEDRVLVIENFLAPKQCKRILEELEFTHWYDSQVRERIAEGLFGQTTTRARISRTTDEYWFGSSLRRFARTSTAESKA